MIKLCIEDNKKEYNELIERSEEVAKLTKEIEESFNENNKLSNKDQKKLQEVEKLLNKIRKDLLASNDDDKDEDEKPSSLVNAIQDLQKNTTELLSALKKTTRHSISVTAIKSSNAVLKLVKFLRFGN